MKYVRVFILWKNTMKVIKTLALKDSTPRHRCNESTGEHTKMLGVFQIAT